MANHKSAKKRIRRNTRQMTVNKERRSRIRTYVKQVELALANGDAVAAAAAFRQAQPELHSGVSKGILHRNTVARKLSRLSSRIKTLSASAS